ncbi:hypothetical protein ZWY2020_003289 [Hordeum vulgare]|nr:hypothetical protein ZWY2020_003289 [Hordeum vulgare]
MANGALLPPVSLAYRSDQQIPDIVIDPSFCGLVAQSEPNCILHRQRPGKFVAFEGTKTGTRFIGCATEQRAMET